MEAVAKPPVNLEALAERAKRVRVDVLKMTYKAGSGHPGGSMSAADLLVALYGTRLRVDPSRPKWDDRDRFILSKGHCCPGLYAVLEQHGFFPREELWRLRRAGGLLQGHSDQKIPGVDMSAGSLGMGLSFANGCALAARVLGKDYRVWVMLGDGECQEGNVWEAAMTTPFRRLDAVTAIVDSNKIQIDGFVSDVKPLEPLAQKWRAFGWDVREIDGHSLREVLDAYDWADRHVGTGVPALIVANTVKGKGVSFMENRAEYHGRALTKEEMARAMEEMGEPWPDPSMGVPA